MADGNAWRLVSQCATVEDVVRVFRTLATADGLSGVRVTGDTPAGGEQVRVVLALSTKLAVLDGDAVVTTEPGTLSVRFVKIDARGKGLLAHMVEHRATETLPPVPRHLVPLGAPAGTPAAARGDASSATCAIEAMVTIGVPRPSEPASTVRMPSARRDPAPPTIRDPAPRGAAAGAEPQRPKREMQKTLMGMPAIAAPTRTKPATAPPPVPIAAGVVAVGTPAGVPTESVPVPRGAGEMKETGPTKPTRGPSAPNPVIAAAANAIAATPHAFESAPTTPTTTPRRVEAAPSGPVDDLPTVPNDDLVTDVAVALPDLPSGDYVDPLVEPPVARPSSPSPPFAAAGSSPGWPTQPRPPMPMPTPGMASPMYAPAPMAMPPMAMPPVPPPPAMPPQPYYPTPYPASMAPVAPGPMRSAAPMMPIDRDDDMTEMVALVRPPRRRWPVIAVTSGVIVLGVAAMIVVAASSGDDSHGPSASQPPVKESPTELVLKGSGEAQPGSLAAPPSALPDQPQVAVAPPAPGPSDSEAPIAAPPLAACTVAFTSSPDAVEVVLGGEVLGTTPFTHTGSCAAYKVTFRRARYQSLTRDVAAGATTLDVRLERPSFRVKVTSRPSGAMVKVGGVELGKTPVTIALPGFETSSIELTRSGHAPATQRVYAGKAGQKVDVRLKPRRR